ncbi:hypothetical protein GCM10027346_40250 [Hymenobacter seoulensis]
MNFFLLLWLSQNPSLLATDEGTQQVIAAALALSLDVDSALPPYERSLLNMVAHQEITLGHMLAYLRENEQA